MKRMTKTGAVRELLQGASMPISLMEAQHALRISWGIILTDSSIGRRFREFGAICERGKDGVFRYRWPRKEQGALFSEKRSVA